jgi:hypothetical protein
VELVIVSRLATRKINGAGGGVMVYDDFTFNRKRISSPKSNTIFHVIFSELCLLKTRLTLSLWWRVQETMTLKAPFSS